MNILTKNNRKGWKIDVKTRFPLLIATIEPLIFYEFDRGY